MMSATIFFYFQRRTLFNLKDTKKNYIKFCDPAVFIGYHGGYGPDNKMTKIKNTNIHTMIDSTLHRKLKIEQQKSGVNSCTP